MSNKTSHRTQYSLVLGLSSLNGTFEKKSLVLPFYPDVLRLGRQTNSKTQPAPDNGYFDSRVLSRAHAEVWTDYDTGLVWIKDSKSSNGTYLNSVRLGNEKTGSEPHQLHKNDVIELGIDIANEEGTSFIHRKISAKVDRISFLSLQTKPVSSKPLQVQNPQSQTLQLHPGPLLPNQQMPQSSDSQIYLQNGYVNGNNANSILSTNNPSTRNQRVQNGGLRPSRSFTESLDVSLFGDVNASLENISLSHARSSVAGLFMNSGVTSSATLEHIVKRLVGEIHAAKVEAAKIQSVKKLLEEISASQHQSRFLGEKLPSLDIFRLRVTKLTEQLEATKEEINEKNKQIIELERNLAEMKEKNELAERSANPQGLNPNSLGTDTNPLPDLQLNEDLNESKSVSVPPENLEFTKCDTLPVKEGTAEIPITSKSSDVEQLQTVLAELEEAKCQLSLFKNRAFAAETLAAQQSKTISKLSATSTDSLVPVSEQASTGPNPGLPIFSVPFASALGVVVVGVSFLAVLNSITREPLKSLDNL